MRRLMSIAAFALLLALMLAQQDTLADARKAVEAARRRMVQIPLTGGTIPHEIVGSHGAGRVLMKPAAPGAGVGQGTAP